MNANLYYKVVYRDPHFNSEKYYGKYLEKRKRFCIEKAGMNIFTFNSTEKALKFIINAKKEKESDKFIFVTSIGEDKSGKRYIEIVRKILNFDVMVLFYSNNTSHFSWIKDFPNCLYTDKPDIYEKYITNYDTNGLLNLKKEVEKKYEKYNLKLKDFSPNFLSVPSDNKISTKPYNHYIRHVAIFCENKNKFLYMTKERKVIGKSDFTEECLWDVTILDRTITLYSNNAYMKEENGKAEGSEYMVEWEFKKFKYKKDNKKFVYAFINPKKDNKNILSLEEDELIINQNDIGENELFMLIDIPEDDKNANDLSFFSYLSRRIEDKTLSENVEDTRSISGSDLINIINSIDNLSV